MRFSTLPIGPQLLGRLKRSLPAHRERKYSPAAALAMFLRGKS